MMHILSKAFFNVCNEAAFNKGLSVTIKDLTMLTISSKNLDFRKDILMFIELLDIYNKTNYIALNSLLLYILKKHKENIDIKDLDVLKCVVDNLIYLSDLSLVA